MGDKKVSPDQGSAAGLAIRRRKETHCLVCDVVVDDTRPYYRRYRTCHICATAEKVILQGEAQRFCQQCGKYEKLDLFDGQARTCRVALARHSERRRNATLERKKRKMQEMTLAGKNFTRFPPQGNLGKYSRVITKTPIPLRLYPEDTEEAGLARKMTLRLMSRLSVDRFPLPTTRMQPSLYPDGIGAMSSKINQSQLSNMPSSQSVAVERGLLALLESMGGAKN